MGGLGAINRSVGYSCTLVEGCSTLHVAGTVADIVETPLYLRDCSRFSYTGGLF